MYYFDEYLKIETVEVEDLVFEVGPALEALHRAGRDDAVHEFRERPERAKAWDVVWLGVHEVERRGGFRDTAVAEIRVPGLVEYVCPHCASRHKRPIRVVRELDSEAEARGCARPRYVYTAICPYGGLLAWLHRRRPPC